MTNRKTAEQIKEEILSCLNEQPSSIEQIRIKIESNWSTVNSYLDELSKEGKVKEIISADKAKIYQRVFGDTYFDLPITGNERKKFRALFSLIIKKYKDVNMTPNKTQLAKAAVNVIKNPNSELELPVAEYLYGAVPLMIANPSEEYTNEFEFNNEQKLAKIIETYIKETKYDSMKKIKEKNHLNYCDRLYSIHDAFLKLSEEEKWNKEKIFKVLNDFFIACPIDEEFNEIFLFTQRFVSTVRKLSYFDLLENNKTKILLTFEALWKYIATYKFYVSMTNRINDKNILNLYLGNAISVRRMCAEESLTDLYSIYWSKIDKREIKPAVSLNEISEIMQDWTGE